MDIHKIIEKIPFKPKSGFVLPSHRYTGPYNPLHEQLDKNDEPLPEHKPFNKVDAISLHHDICYRDHNTKKGKADCDTKMLADLEVLKPANIREKIDRKIVRSIMKTKQRMGWGIQWSNELADELHKPIRRKFQKRKVFAKTSDDIWSADLIEMIPLAKYNKGYKYLLMIIDVFSKYGWIVPIKTKTGSAVSTALEKVIKTSKRVPSKLWVDKGKEFYNKTMQQLLKKKGISMYSTENEEKSSVVERWNRTIKRYMWKYFTANNTHTYINILPELVEKYNNTYHRSIKTTPSKAIKPSNFNHVYTSLYGNMKELARKPKFNVGDWVRISKKKKTFEKGFTTNWSEELFIITKVRNTKPPTYEIEDLNGKPIQGTFYEPELQKSKQSSYRIEKVLKRRKAKSGQKEVYVKWRGYDSSFNSWIPLSDVRHGNQ